MAAPDTKDRRRPLELIALSAGLAAIVFVVVLMGTRDPLLSLQFAGLGFIVSLVVFAMLALATRPGDAEEADIAEQNDQEPPAPRGH